MDRGATSPCLFAHSRMTQMRRRAVAAFCLGIAALWFLGGNAFSLESTSRIAGPVIEWILPGSSLVSSRMLFTIFRKLLHFFLYGGLALLALRMLILSSVPPIRASLLAIGLTLAVGMADEGRQALSENRTGRWSDVLIDAVGAVGAVGAAGVGVFCVNRLRISKRDS